MCIRDRFSILNPPDTLQNYVSFTSDIHEPDGIWVNSTGTVVCTGGEYDGKICVRLLNCDVTPGDQHYANLADDLPSSWTWTDERKGIEPEAPEAQTKNIIQEKDSSSQETVEIVEKPNLINTLEGLMEKLQDEDTTGQKGLTKLVETRKQNLETDPKTP